VLIASKSSHCNVDGDVVVYAAGFASQSNEYWVDKDVFDTKKEAAHFCVRYDIDQEEIEVRVIPEPIAFCLETVKRMVAGIVKDSSHESYTLVLTGKDNFRVAASTIQPYKGHRTAAKPVHYDKIREYMIAVLNTIVIDGEEADDYLSYRTLSHNETICTIDKDLNNTEGWHYNWQQKLGYYVSEREADQNFWVQMLSGDATDNIPGLYKLTGTKCSAGMKAEVESCLNYREMRTAVIETYQRAFEKLSKKMGVGFIEDAELYDMLTEIGQLLWMRREPNEMWSIDYGS
jgi:hypothetical protein